MGGIFISYRSGSHAVSVGALADRLRHYFGADLVFADTQLEPGTSYPDELRKRLLGSDVLLAVIHDRWLETFDQPRDKDWVLFEIATALDRGIPVVPVLLEKVDPPLHDQLPKDIGAVAYLQAGRVRGKEFRSDVDFLVRLLEQHVVPDHAPPTERPAGPKRKPVGRRIIAWATGLSLATPILFFDFAPFWEWFASAAFGSATVLSAFSLLSMTLIPMVKRLTRRWDDEAGTISLREAIRRRWILPAIGLLPPIYLLINGGPGGQEWQEWQVWFVVVTVLFLLYFTHRMWRQVDAHDHQWPPPVSTEPEVFRRAAHRLHERLTTEPDWRSPRSLANQREAESVYRSLDEVRLQLTTRASVSLPQWIRNGYSGETARYLGWAASILVLDIVALVASVGSDSATLGKYGVIAVTVVAAVGFTAGKTAVDYYSDRREVRRWIGELTKSQGRLKPLIGGSVE